MKSFKPIYAFLLLLISYSCSNNSIKEYKTIQEKVAELANDLQYISQEDFKIQFDNSGFFLLVDCREESEFEEGHIKNAINIQRGLLEFSKKLANKNDRIFLYSDSTDRAVLGAASLKRLNYRRVSVIEGGYNAWRINYPKKIEEETEYDEEDDGC